MLKRARDWTKVLIGFAFLVFLPVISPAQQVEAMPMEQIGHNIMVQPPEDCLVNCVRTSVTVPTPIRLPEQEVTSPDPDPRAEVPFYVQFQGYANSAVISPHYHFGTVPLRPPDIVLQSVRFRF